jgi:hypothetical protein
MLAAAVTGFAVHTIERLQGEDTFFGTFAAPATREAAFVQDWQQRLAEHPALLRRTEQRFRDRRQGRGTSTAR